MEQKSISVELMNLKCIFCSKVTKKQNDQHSKTNNRQVKIQAVSLTMNLLLAKSIANVIAQT
jgi:hypothetical protein